MQSIVACWKRIGRGKARIYEPTAQLLFGPHLDHQAIGMQLIPKLDSRCLLALILWAG